MDEERLPLFVFGTLRRGHGNHHYLDGRYRHVEAARLNGYRRGTAAHGFPAALPAGPADSIEGELFDLDPAVYEPTLAAVDLLEDLPPGERIGPFYDRLLVEVETASGRRRAWAYISPRPEQTRDPG